MNNFDKVIANYVEKVLQINFTYFNLNYTEKPNTVDYYNDFDKSRNFLFTFSKLIDSNTLGLKGVNETAIPSSFPHSRPLKSLLNQLKYMRYLKYLDLRDNDMNTKELKVLVDEIKNCRNLKSIDISNNPIGDEGFKLLIPYLSLLLIKKNIYNEYLSLSNMNLTSKSIHLLCQNLHQISNVEVINLSYNYINKNGFEEFSNSCSVLKKLHKLIVVEAGYIGVDITEYKSNIQKNCPSLKIVKSEKKINYEYKS